MLATRWSNKGEHGFRLCWLLPGRQINGLPSSGLFSLACPARSILWIHGSCKLSYIDHCARHGIYNQDGFFAIHKTAPCGKAHRSSKHFRLLNRSIGGQRLQHIRTHPKNMFLEPWMEPHTPVAEARTRAGEACKALVEVPTWAAGEHHKLVEEPHTPVAE